MMRRAGKESITISVNGFRPRETALIALLSRYHRKGTPSPSAYKVLLESTAAPAGAL